MKNVIFAGREQAEASFGLPHWAVISISESDSKPANLKEGWHSVLRLEFDDIDSPQDPYQMFNANHANQIIDFVDRIQNGHEVESILVHCRAGISRSAAVAKWIAEQHSIPFNEQYALYNKHVYSTLRSVMFDRLFGQGVVLFQDKEGV